MTGPLDKTPLDRGGRFVEDPLPLGASDSKQTRIDLALKEMSNGTGRQRRDVRRIKEAMEMSGEFADIRNSLMAREGSDPTLISTCSQSIDRLGALQEELLSGSYGDYSKVKESLSGETRKLEQTRKLSRPVQVPSQLKSNVGKPIQEESEITQLSRAISRVEAVSQMFERGITGISKKVIEDELKDLNHKLEASKKLHRDEISGEIEASLKERRVPSVRVTSQSTPLSLYQSFENGTTRTYNKIDGKHALGDERLSGGTKRSYGNYNADLESSPVKGKGIVSSLELEELPGGYRREYEIIEGKAYLVSAFLPYGITIRYAHARDPETNEMEVFVNSISSEKKGRARTIIQEGTLGPGDSKDLGELIYEKDLSGDGYISILESGQVEILHDDGRYSIISPTGDHIEHPVFHERSNMPGMPPIFMSQSDGTHLNLASKYNEKTTPEGTLSISDTGVSKTFVKSNSEVQDRPWSSNA